MSFISVREAIRVRIVWSNLRPMASWPGVIAICCPSVTE